MLISSVGMFPSISHPNSRAWPYALPISSVVLRMDDEVISLHLGLPRCHPTLVTPPTVAPRSLRLSPVVWAVVSGEATYDMRHSMKCPLATAEIPYHLEPASLYISLMASSLMEPLLHRGSGGSPIFGYYLLWTHSGLFSQDSCHECGCCCVM